MSAGNGREFIDHLQSKEKGGRSMKCPLFVAAVVTKAGTTKGAHCDCLEEECGVWDNKFEGCSILELNRTLYLIHEYMERLVNKMPHEKQFRR